MRRIIRSGTGLFAANIRKAFPFSRLPALDAACSPDASGQ